MAKAEVKTLGELILRITRDQVHQGTDAKYLIGLKALDRGWSTAGEQAFIAKFLASPRYLELQREREPHLAVIASTQAKLRKLVQAGTVQELCESTQITADAITKSYDINQMEIAVLKFMLEAE